MSKKLLTVFLSIVLVLSMTVPSMAASVASPGTTQGKGEGDTEYLNTEIFDVVLPTNAAFNFTLDPLGLLSLNDGDTSDYDKLDGGKIIGAVPQPFVNDSSYPVKVTVALTATTDKGNGGAAPEATFIDDPENIEDKTGTNNILLFVAGSTQNWNDPDPASAPADDNYVMAANGFVLADDSAVELVYSLPAANYIVTNTGGAFSMDVEDGTGSGNALKVGGFVNSRADWKEFSAKTATDPADLSKVGIDFEFTLEKDTDAENYTEADFDGDVEFMLKNAAATTVDTGVVTKYTITAISDDTDKGTISGLSTDGIYVADTKVTLVATPKTGFEFEGWYKDGTKVTGATATHEFTVDSDFDLVAKFVAEAAKYTITAVSENLTMGTVSGLSAGGVYTDGTKVTLTATPEVGYDFEGWYKDGTKVTGATATHEFTVDSSYDLVAKFVAQGPTDYTTSGFITNAATFTTASTKTVSSVNKANDVIVDFVLVDGETISQVKWQTGGTTLASGSGYVWNAANKQFTVKGGGTTSLGGTTTGAKTVTIVTDKNATGYVLTLNVL